jgi:hypothetical protein
VNPANIGLVIDLALSLIARAQAAIALAKRGNVTDAELAALVAEDDAARAELQAEIDKRKV